MSKNKKKITKKLKRPPMPGAGRPKTGTAKDWTRVNVQKSTKLQLEMYKIMHNFKSIDDLILASMQHFKTE